MTLFIFCGIPFSGKSVLLKKLSQTFGLVRVDLDEVKRDLLGDVTDETVSQAQWDDVYNEMYKRIGEMQPPSGTDVIIIDGTSSIGDQVKQIHDKFLK